MLDAVQYPFFQLGIGIAYRRLRNALDTSLQLAAAAYSLSSGVRAARGA